MIRWTVTALEHLAEIQSSIAKDNPTAATRQCQLIHRAVETLDRFPEMAPEADANRRLVVPKTSYVVFYRVLPDCVIIRAIWHGARRPTRLEKIVR